MADTVVQYVLRVDSKGAQKALDSTAKEADDLTKSLVHWVRIDRRP